MNEPQQDLVKASVAEVEADIYQTPQWKKAVMLSRCDFVPHHCKGKPWNVLFILEVAKDLQLLETFALQNLFMTPDGKLGMEAVVARAILLSKGYEIHYHESSAEKAVVEVVRPKSKAGDSFGAFKSTWDMARANKISFKNKNGEWKTLPEKFNWKMYPTQMLRHRALMEAAREVAADDLGGVLSTDEMEDSINRDEETLTATAEAAEDQQKIDPDIIPVEVQQTITEAAHKAGSSIEHAQAAMLKIQKWLKEQPDPLKNEVIEGCKRELRKLHVQYIEQKDARQQAKEEAREALIGKPSDGAPPPPEYERPPTPGGDAKVATPDLAAATEESSWADELTDKERTEILG